MYKGMFLMHDVSSLTSQTLARRDSGQIPIYMYMVFTLNIPKNSWCVGRCLVRAKWMRVNSHPAHHVNTP